MSEKEVKIEKCNVLEQNRQYLNVTDYNEGDSEKGRYAGTIFYHDRSAGKYLDLFGDIQYDLIGNI